MEYVITNSKKEIFIRLNSQGKAETCNKTRAERFERSKANNILNNLPKYMKRLHFKVEYMPKTEMVKDIVEQTSVYTSSTVIANADYTVPDTINTWLEKVRTCNELAKEAAKRKLELENALSNVDRDLSNCLHEIELTRWKNGCRGYMEYKKMKLILENRRKVKDELSVVTSILSCNLQSMATDRIKKVVDGLSNRKFTMRDIVHYENL